MIEAGARLSGPGVLFGRGVHMSRKILYKLMFALLLVVFLVSGGTLLIRHLEFSRSVVDYEDALRIAGLDQSRPPQNASQPPVDQAEPESGSFSSKAKEPDGSESAGAVEEESSAEPEPVIPAEAEPLSWMDLDALKEVNPDVLGWLEIPGVLSYPLVQAGDNQYYLNRSWNGEYNACGSIFLECENNPDLCDFHTIVYGHRMDNDSMFGVLRFYQQQDFWQEHPRFYVADGNCVREYEIFAAFEASVKGIVYHLELEGKEEEFITQCLSSSDIDTGVEPSAGDQIMTLSTCPRSGYANRLVVMGRLAQVYA